MPRIKNTAPRGRIILHLVFEIVADPISHFCKRIQVILLGNQLFENKNTLPDSTNRGFFIFPNLVQSKNEVRNLFIK